MAAEIGTEILQLGQEVYKAIEAEIKDENDRRENFTRKYVGQATQKFPGYNVVIIHTAHSRSGTFVHSHEEWPTNIFGTTTGFEAYFSKIGDTFELENEGDGGFINWCFAGNFRRGGDRNNRISAYNPSLPNTSVPTNTTLKNKSTSNCLDSNTEGKVYALQGNGGNYQKWYFHDQGGGVFTIQNVGTSLFLDSNDEGKVYALNGNGGNYQKWYFHDQGGGVFTIQNVATLKYLDSNGEQQVYTLFGNGGDNQKWQPQ